MTKPRRFLWSSAPPRPIPQHPYRDSALIYGVLAIALVLIAWAAGTSIGRAIVLALFVFVFGLGWSTLSWRRRLREQDRGPEFPQ